MGERHRTHRYSKWLVSVLVAIALLSIAGSTVGYAEPANPTPDAGASEDGYEPTGLPDSCVTDGDLSSGAVVEGGTDAADGDDAVDEAEDSDGDDVYGTIQAAVDQVNASSVVCVLSDTYREQITISQNITLIAPDGASLVGSTFSNDSIGIEFEGSTPAPHVIGIRIAEFDVGIDARETSHDWLLRNVTVEHARIGVEARRSGGDWRILDSRIHNTTENGVSAWSTTGEWLVKNTTISESDNGLMAVSSSGDWRLENVTFDSYFDDAVGAFEASGDWTFRNVTIRDSPGSQCFSNGVGAEHTSGNWSVIDTQISNSSCAGLSALNSSGAWVIRNSTIHRGQIGVYARYSSGDWTIERASISQAISGVSAPDSSGNWTVHDVTFSHTGQAVAARRSGGNWLVRSSVIGAAAGGIVARKTSGQWAIHNTSFLVDDPEGITAIDAQQSGNATRNWWGTPAGPDTDECVGNVSCDPWLLAPPGPDSPVRGELPPIVGSDPPTDPDGDGRYEDTNGDGEFGIVDVQLLFANRHSKVVRNTPTVFDFNGDGGFGIGDIQQLFVDFTES